MLMLKNVLDQEPVWLRGEEYDRIWMLLEMFMESSLPLSFSVVAWGGPGTGKTSVAKSIMANAKSMWNNLKTVYLNSMSEKGFGLFKALQQIQDLRGYSAVELLENLERSRAKLFIVIDNAEVLREERLIQAILRIGEAFPQGGFFILMLFKSINTPVNVLSVTPPIYLIYFRPYNFDEIRRILDNFVRNCNHCFFSEKALDNISKAAGGDAELALMILKASLNIAGGNHVDETHVSKVLERLSENPFGYISGRLDLHAKMILRILSEHPQGISLRKLFEEYIQLTEMNGVKPLGYTQLWKRIRIMERRMLLNFEVVNLKGGRTGVVRMKCMSQTMNL
ncbi:MAG: AAA family ATPase [Thermoproteota archaeon]